MGICVVKSIKWVKSPRKSDLKVSQIYEIFFSEVRVDMKFIVITSQVRTQICFEVKKKKNFFFLHNSNLFSSHLKFELKFAMNSKRRYAHKMWFFFLSDKIEFGLEIW